MKIRLVAYRKATSSATVDTTYDLDLQKAPNISLNFQFSDIKEPEQRKANFSQTFKLPFTNNNNKFFQDWYNVNLETLVFSTRTTFPAVLYAGGVSQFEGNLQLKAVYKKAQYYQVCLFSNTADLFSVIGNNKLQDVFLNDDGTYSNELNHQYTHTNLKRSWNGSSSLFTSDCTDCSGASLRDTDVNVQKVMYPLSFTVPTPYYDSSSAQYLNFNAGDSTTPDVPITQFRPAIQLKTLFKLIIAKAGFSYTSDFIDGSYFGKLFMTTCNHFTTPGPVVEPNEIADAGIMSVGNSSSWGTISVNNNDVQSDNWVLLPANTVEPISSSYVMPSDIADMWNEQYNYYEHKTMTFSLSVRMKMTIDNVESADGGPITMKAKLVKFNTTTNTPVMDDVFSYNALGEVEMSYVNGGYEGYVFMFTGLMDVGDCGQIYVSVNNWKRNSSSSNGVVTYGGATTDVMDGLYSKVSLEWSGGNPYTNVYNKEVLVPQGIDPSITQKAFLKDIIERFNLVFLTDPNDANNIIIKPYNDYLADGEIKYWTEKLDTSKEVVVKDTLSLQKKEIEFSDLEDEDIVNKSVKEESPDLNVWGKFTSTQNNNDFATGTLKNNPIFSPYINSQIFVNEDDQIPTQLNNLAVHYEFSYERVEGGYENKLVETKPKLFYYSGATTPLINPANPSVTPTIYMQQRTPVTNFYSFQAYPLCTPYELDGSSGTCSIATTTKSLHWGSQTAFIGNLTVFNSYATGISPENSLYKLYWDNYLNGIYGDDARIMECYVNLTETDIFQFKFNDEIFIKDSYWRIINIHNYQVGASASTKVTLLKINDSYSATCNDCDYVVGDIGDYNLWGAFYIWCPSGTPGCTPALPPSTPSGLFAPRECCDCLGGTVYEGAVPTLASGIDQSFRMCAANSNSLPAFAQNLQNPVTVFGQTMAKSIITGKLSNLNRPLLLGSNNAKNSYKIMPYSGDDIVIKYANKNIATPQVHGEAHKMVLLGYTTGTDRGYAYPQGSDYTRRPMIPINSTMIIRVNGTATVVGGTSTDYTVGYLEAFSYYTAFKNKNGTITQIGTAGGVQEFIIAEVASRCSLFITQSNGELQFGLDDSIATTKRSWTLTVDLTVQEIANMNIGYGENWALYQKSEIITLQNYDWLIWN